MILRVGEMTEKFIRIDRRVSATTLLLCWLFIFLLPAITFQLCLDWLFDLTFKANCRAVNHQLINELTRFKKQATTEYALEKMLEDSFNKMFESDHKFSKNELVRLIEEKTGAKVALLVRHGASTKELQIVQSKEFSKFINVLPRKLTQRFLLELCKDGIANEGKLFLRQQFMLIAEPALVVSRVCKSVSGKFRGPVYFYYCPKRSQGKTVEGFFLMIIGREINYRRILESSLVSENALIKRSFEKLGFELPRRMHNNNSIISSFTTDLQGYSLSGMPLQEMVVDLIQRGTLFPYGIETTVKKMPVLRVSIANRHLQHLLFPYRENFRQGLLLGILFGAIMLLHLHLFGENFRAGLRQKALIGLALITFLPIALLLVATVTWSEFSFIEERYLNESRIRNIAESAQQKFNDHLANSQLQTLNLAKELENEKVVMSGESIKNCLKRFIEATGASMAGYDHLVSGSTFVSNEIPTGIEKNEEEILKDASRTLLNTFDQNGNFNLSYIDGVNNSFSAVNPAFVNEMLCSSGRLFEYGRFRTGNRYSIVAQLFAGKPSARALVIVRYSAKSLLKGFAEKFFQQNQSLGNMGRVRLFRYEFEADKPRFFNCFNDERIENQHLQKQLNDALQGNGTLLDGSGRKIRLFQLLAGFPMIINVESNEIETEEFYLKTFFVVAVSIILLMVFAYLVLGKIYIDPIQEFVRVTRSVARNELNCCPQIKSRDEFLHLKSAFVEMIEGISQKETMSQFVSQDVLDAVHENLPSGLEPGGEKVESTVCFVRMPLLSSLKKPEEIVRHLSFFMELIESLTIRYSGTIDKIIEDTIMLVFRGENHALKAANTVLEASLACRQEKGEIQAGIASGTVISGKIGSRLGKLDFTVIGDTVNLAARLKTEAKSAKHTGIIIAPSTIRLLRGKAGVEFLKRVAIKGKSREYPLYELTKLR
jgi:hypothetical protein